MMQATEMKIRSPKNPPETIIDHSPEEPFVSPLDQFIASHCKKCQNWKTLCRLQDKHGLKRMELCIYLYCNPIDLAMNFLNTGTLPSPLETVENLEGKP